MQVRDEVVEHLFPGGRHEGRTMKMMRQTMAKVQEMKQQRPDWPVEIIASKGFAELIQQRVTAFSQILKDNPIGDCSVRTDSAMATGTAIIRYASGKMLYLSPEAPQRTPEEEEERMREFMAAPPPPNPFAINHVPISFLD